MLSCIWMDEQWIACTNQLQPDWSFALSVSGFAQMASNGSVIGDYGQHITGPTTSKPRSLSEVRPELLRLPSDWFVSASGFAQITSSGPYYSLFDDLEFSVQGPTLTLSGYVTGIHAATVSDAEKVVKNIEGVNKVVNNIKLLSPSLFDDQVGNQTYATLSRTRSLSGYFGGRPLPVSAQSWTISALHGTASPLTRATRTWLPSPANAVPGVLRVTNELQVVK